MTRRTKLAIVAALVALLAIVPATFSMHLQAKGVPVRPHFAPISGAEHHAS